MLIGKFDPATRKSFGLTNVSSIWIVPGGCYAFSKLAVYIVENFMQAKIDICQGIIVGLVLVTFGALDVGAQTTMWEYFGQSNAEQLGTTVFTVADLNGDNLRDFVATGQGGHVFSATLREQNRAVRKYVKYLRAQKKKKL